MKLQMLGPLFDSRADMGFDLFSWLACRDLNKEEVALTLYSEFVVNIGFAFEFSIAFEPNLDLHPIGFSAFVVPHYREHHAPYGSPGQSVDPRVFKP
ncbi:hypothetical protein PG987_001492 [Apiospora arundinis]